MIAKQTLSIRSRDGLPLHARMWRADDPVAWIVVSHGLGEHLARYAYLAEALSRFNVLAFDYRGHGNSGGARGSVSHYDRLLDDLDAALQYAEAQNAGKPLFVLGHSHGALLALRAARQWPGRIAALVLSSPAFRLSIPVPLWKRGLGRILRWVAPQVPVGGSIPSHWLSSRPGYDAERRADPMLHTLVCAHVYYGMQAWGKRLALEATEFHVPLLILGGAKDRVTCPRAMRDFAAALGPPNAECHIWEGAAHEPLNDDVREDVLRTTRNWLLERVRDSVSLAS